jgi:predicted DNA-binding ribbon-helix-helix protein
VAKRSVTIAGHRTSLSLEQSFWDALGEIAAAKKTSIAGVIAEIDRDRSPQENLSAAIRVFVLGHFRKTRDG